jgi:hypothetical protein
MISITDAKENDKFTDDIREDVVNHLPEDDNGVAHVYEFSDGAEKDPFKGYLVIGSPSLVYHMVRTNTDDNGDTTYNYMGSYVPTVDGNVMPEGGLGQNLSDSLGGGITEMEGVIRSFHHKCWSV